MKKIKMFLILFILTVTTAGGETNAPEFYYSTLTERKETLINIIIPFVFKKWNSVKEKNSEEHIVQAIKQIILENAITEEKDKNFYHIIIIFRAKNYRKNEIINEAVFSQNVYFVIKEKNIENWLPMEPIMQEYEENKKDVNF